MCIMHIYKKNYMYLTIIEISKINKKEKRKKKKGGVDPYIPRL